MRPESIPESNLQEIIKKIQHAGYRVIINYLLLKITHLSKRYGSLQALDSLSFDVGVYELVGFVGANGTDKR